MRDIKQKIINVLKEKGSELSTTELISLITDDYERLKVEGKYNSARQLHRKILYHINRLVSERILRLEKYGKNGKKFFTLNVGEGEVLYEIAPTRYKKRLIGDQLMIPPMPIEGYEQEGIIKKYEQSTWVERLNSIVILCNRIKDKKELNELIENLYPVINDSICLENFELLINKKKYTRFLKELDKKCRYYGKRINCVIDISQLENEKDLLDVLTENLKNIYFIFCLNKDILQQKINLLQKILEIYLRENKTIYIKNTDLSKTPYFIGRAGAYTFDEEEWLTFKKPKCVGCSQSSVIVDINEFCKDHGVNIARFTELLMNVSKSFLSINPIQRRKLRSYFKKNILINDNYEKDFLEFSRNYIRFSNIEPLQQKLNKKTLFEILEKAKARVSAFCRAEDRIYNSCGMAIRFKIALSTVENESITINNGSDLRSPKIQDKIEENLKISSILDGGTVTKFIRPLFNETSNDIINEILFILTKCDLPLFAYSFNGGKNGN